MWHDLVVVLTSVLTALLTVGLPLWYKNKKAITDAKDELYAAQMASHIEERRLEVEERIKQARRMSDIVDGQDRKILDLQTKIGEMHNKLAQCDEERYEYKHTMLRQEGQLTIAQEKHVMLEDIIDRQNRIIDAFSEKLEKDNSLKGATQ